MSADLDYGDAVTTDDAPGEVGELVDRVYRTGALVVGWPDGSWSHHDPDTVHPACNKPVPLVAENADTPNRPHIGLTARAHSGKDAAADALTATGYTRIGFADALKAMAYDINPYVRLNTSDGAPHFMRLADLVDMVGWDQAKTHEDVRRFLQRLGSDGVRRHVGNTTWIDIAMRHATVPSVFTDVRFPNEADAIRAAGGLVVRIIRPDAAPVAAHESETAMDAYPVDAEIVNDGTLDDLHAAILAVVA